MIMDTDLEQMASKPHGWVPVEGREGRFVGSGFDESLHATPFIIAYKGIRKRL